MATLYWTTVGFLSGSLMFSVWIARLFLAADIRRFGDGNPGSGNVWRAGGGWRLGIPAALLDYGKAAMVRRAPTAAQATASAKPGSDRRR